MLKFENFLFEDLDISILYKYINYINNKINVNINKRDYIGSGSHGVVFKLDDNKILKISNDIYEAKMSQYLKNMSTEYLINCDYIYDVSIGNNIFVLIMDKLNIHEDNINYRIIWDWILYYINNDISVILNKDIKFIINEISMDDDIIMTYDEVEKYIYINWDSIYGITNEIYFLDIKQPDLHVGNIGYNDDSELIYFDVREMTNDKKDLSKIKIKRI